MGRRTNVISQLELSPVELELLLLLSNARRKTRGEQIKYFTQHRCIIIIRSDFTRKTKTLKQFYVIQFGSAAAVAHKRDLRQPDKRRNRKKKIFISTLRSLGNDNLLKRTELSYTTRAVCEFASFFLLVLSSRPQIPFKC